MVAARHRAGRDSRSELGKTGLEQGGRSRLRRPAAGKRPRMGRLRQRQPDRGVRPRRSPMMARASLFLLALAVTASMLAAQQGAGQVEWLYYGGDQAGSKYSPLTDINAGNVPQLRVAWQW